MLTFNPIPQARVVRKGGQLYAAPPAPRHHDETTLGEHLHNAAAIAIGLWPLTAIVLLCTGLLIMAGNNATP